MSKSGSETRSHKEEEAAEERASQKSGEENGSHAGSQGSESGKKKKIDKNDPDYKHPIIGLIIFTILAFLSLLFITIATPIEWFVLNDEYSGLVVPDRDASKPICVTAWGLKNGCRHKKYIHTDFITSFCYRVRTDFKVIEAFCIMTIGFTTLSLICGILSICHVVGKGTAAALGTFSALMGVIVWGIAAGMYYQKPCCETTNWLNPNKETTCFFTSQLNGDLEEVDVPAFKHMGKYGPAFGLAVTAWAVMVLGTIFAYLPF